MTKKTTPKPVFAFPLENQPTTAPLLVQIEKIHWNKPADCMPDADETVLIFTPRGDDPVWLGYYDGTTWITVEGFPMADNEVTFWSPMPRGPE